LMPHYAAGITLIILLIADTGHWCRHWCHMAINIITPIWYFLIPIRHWFSRAFADAATSSFRHFQPITLYYFRHEWPPLLLLLLLLLLLILPLLLLLLYWYDITLRHYAIIGHFILLPLHWLAIDNTYFRHWCHWPLRQ
jgi:hypothetical protein